MVTDNLRKKKKCFTIYAYNYIDFISDTSILVGLRITALFAPVYFTVHRLHPLQHLQYQGQSFTKNKQEKCGKYNITRKYWNFKTIRKPISISIYIDIICMDCLVKM